MPRFSGEVSERLKEQHWKCCWRLKPPRGFESRPLRFFSQPTQGAYMLARSCCFLATLFLFAGALCAADEPSYDQSAVPLEQDILPGAPKIILIAGSKSHGPMEHEFFAGSALLQNLLKQNGINAVMARDGWP